MSDHLTCSMSLISRRTVLVGFATGALTCIHASRAKGAFVQDASPAALEEGTDVVQFDMTLSEPVLPAGQLYLWSTMYSLQPETSVEYPGFPIESPVAAIVWVQSGLMEIDGDVGTVHHASATPIAASPVAGEVLLGPDDAVALELGPGYSYQMRNAGTEPLLFAEYWLVGGPRPSFPDPPGYQILDFYHDPSTVTLPTAATATMHLTRMTLGAGETLSTPEDGWQMVLTEDPASISRSWPGGAPTNFGDEPIAIVIMTADFQTVEGTPSAVIRR